MLKVDDNQIKRTSMCFLHFKDFVLVVHYQLLRQRELLGYSELDNNNNNNKVEEEE